MDGWMDFLAWKWNVSTEDKASLSHSSLTLVPPGGVLWERKCTKVFCAIEFIVRAGISAEPPRNQFFNFFPKVCDRSRSPQWNEAFCFLVRDPIQEMLIVKVAVPSPRHVVRSLPPQHHNRLNVFFSSSCPVRGTSQWELWCSPSKTCFPNHSWSWISGSIWTALYLTARFCWGRSWR